MKSIQLKLFAPGGIEINNSAVLVVDASVIVKWYVDEKYSQKAIKLRDDYIEGKITIVTPSLAIFEVLNALKFTKLYSTEELQNISKSLFQYQFVILSLDETTMHVSIDMAMESDTTIYDVYYLAICKNQKYRYYSADDKFLAKIKLQNFNIDINHIRDY
ncbi:MAG: type II toxin-antitoxin system VapC family toxin [Candidatus Kariarchaeaceae archaeon]|jgi:predicted nucleic acid-binding protein